MRFRTTLILLLLLIGLGGYVYWVEYPKAEQEAKKKTLFEFKPEDATAITLKYADREIALKKSGDEWRLTTPIDAAADATAVKNLVNAIAECEVKKELTGATADLSQYGLDKPLVTVTVTLKDRELPGIVVGKNTPVGFNTYIERTDDKKILLTSAAFHSGMDKQVKDLRDKTIVSFADPDVQKVELWTADKQITMTHKDDTWTIESPGPYAADGATVRSFLSTLRSMRATDFPDDHPSDLSTYGLDNPRMKITLYLGKDNAEKRILVGKETDKKELYVQASGVPTVYTVSDWVYRDLDKGLGDFRDKTLLSFDRSTITAVSVTPKDGSPFKLVRGDNNQWHVDGRQGTAAETAISQFLGDLHDLKGYEVLADQPKDLAQFGLDRPMLSLTVYGAGDKAIGTVLLAPRPGGEAKKEYAAMLEGGPTVFLVRDYLVTRLNKKADDFVTQPTPTVGPGTPSPEPASAVMGNEGADDDGDAD